MTTKQRGRPRIYHTDEERAEARKNYTAKTVNVTLDADLLAMLHREATAIASIIGFRPTLSQTVRYLLKQKTK